MNWKKLGRALMYPHPVVLIAADAAGLVLVIYALALLEPTAPLSIAAYGLSFYATLATCLRIPDIVRFVQRFRQENKYYLLYKNDVQLRVKYSLYVTCAFNGVYALFQLCLGLWHHSAWFYAMAGYYCLLAVMRLTLARHTRHHAPGEDAPLEWRRYRLCGVLLLVMNLTLMVFILYFVFRVRTFDHHEVTVIAMAAYTFSALALAIVNVVRFRKYGSPAYSAAKAISLVSAVVSVLTLENAMLTAFGQESSPTFQRIMLGATGAAVLCAVQGVALYMIVTANRKLKKKA